MNAEPAIITLREVYDAVQDLGRRVGSMPSTVTDHETRIRALERRVWQAAGAATVLGALVSQAAAQLLSG